MPSATIPRTVPSQPDNDGFNEKIGELPYLEYQMLRRTQDQQVLIASAHLIEQLDRRPGLHQPVPGTLYNKHRRPNDAPGVLHILPHEGFELDKLARGKGKASSGILCPRLPQPFLHGRPPNDGLTDVHRPIGIHHVIPGDLQLSLLILETLGSGHRGDETVHQLRILRSHPYSYGTAHGFPQQEYGYPGIYLPHRLQCHADVFHALLEVHTLVPAGHRPRSEPPNIKGKDNHTSSG